VFGALPLLSCEQRPDALVRTTTPARPARLLTLAEIASRGIQGVPWMLPANVADPVGAAPLPPPHETTANIIPAMSSRIGTSTRDRIVASPGELQQTEPVPEGVGEDGDAAPRPVRRWLVHTRSGFERTLSLRIYIGNP